MGLFLTGRRPGSRYTLLSRIRAQANREAMAVLAERETANTRHFQQLCP
jgi:hypothetical protein